MPREVLRRPDLDRPVRALPVGDPDLEGGHVRAQAAEVEGHLAVQVAQPPELLPEPAHLVVHPAQFPGQGLAPFVEGAAQHVQPGPQLRPELAVDVGDPALGWAAPPGGGVTAGVRHPADAGLRTGCAAMLRNIRPA
ncbi:MAG: hypothetical protein M3Q47_06440 [Actinomycetota bacterium]|nr:hypothetical protein [Actinomycetota bacterium]